MITDQTLARQRASDEQTIAALAKAGADLDKPHALEHHFVCRDPAAAGAIRAWGEERGYTCSEVAEDVLDGARYAYFDLIKRGVVDIDAVTAETTAMLELAAKHDAVEYDGWGCEVVQ